MAGPSIQLGLFPKQERFVRNKRRFTAAIGGIGSGKTYVGSMKALTKLPVPEMGMICAPTYRMLKDSTQRTFFQVLDSLGFYYEYNKTDNHIKFPNTGAEIIFRSLDNPDNVRGPNINWAWVDEAAYISAEAWRIVKGRIRVGPNQQGWITGTPKGRNWIYEEFVVNADDNHAVYRFRTSENTTLPADFADSLGYTGRFAAQELEGLFVAFEGLVYGQFDRGSMVRRVDTKGWSSIQGVDIGARNPTVVLTIYLGAGNRVHVGGEFYKRNMNAIEIVDSSREEIAGANAEAVYFDPSARAYITTLQGEGYNVYPANNSIRDGIQLVSYYLRPEVFTIDPSCVHTIAEFESYQYPEEGKGDIPIKQNDHCMDALRYGIMGAFGEDNPENNYEALEEYLRGQLAGAE